MYVHGSFVIHKLPMFIMLAICYFHIIALNLLYLLINVKVI